MLCCFWILCIRFGRERLFDVYQLLLSRLGIVPTSAI
jgi:hypothetical protein